MKTEYIKPENRVHQLHLKDGILQSASLGGGGKATTSGEYGEARSFDDEDNSSSTPSSTNIWEDQW